jgi:hypothetical protein
MKKGRRFVGAVALSILFSVGLSFGGGATRAYAAGPDPATAVSQTRLCAALADYIRWLETNLPAGPLKDYLLRVAGAVYSRYC